MNLINKVAIAIFFLFFIRNFFFPRSFSKETYCTEFRSLNEERKGKE